MMKFVQEENIRSSAQRKDDFEEEMRQSGEIFLFNHQEIPYQPNNYGLKLCKLLLFLVLLHC